MSSTVGCCSSRGPVKIVIINTQYVETDATSFKSVVQKLTGKDSDDDDQLLAKAHDEIRKKKKHNHNYQRGVDQAPNYAAAVASDLGTSSFCMRGATSFDKLLSEMPPINVDDIWSEYNYKY